MAGFWERELMARQQREQRVAEQQRAAEQRRFEEQRRRQQEEARRRAEERSRAADAARLRAQAEAQRRAEVEAGNRALAEARAAEARRAAMARQQTVPATSVAPVVQEAEQRSFWDRFSLPTGTPMVRPVPLEEQPSVEEFAAQMRPAGQLVSDVLFGPEMESVRPGTQDAGLLERFIRTQAGEQEFRVAGQRAQEGRPAAAVGWTALGLAGLIPFAGDIVQGAAGASRAVRGAGGLARATGAAGDVARGAEGVTGGVARFAEPLIEQGRIIPQQGIYLGRTIEDARTRVRNAFSLEPTDNRGMPDQRDPSDALAIFDEIIDEYSPGFVDNPMVQTGNYVPDFNVAKGVNNAISDEIIAEISRRLGRRAWGAPAPITPKFAEQFADAISDLDLTVSTDLNGLIGFASSGRYASGFETGVTSSGSWWPGFRSSAERSMFDIPENAPASARPVYGFLSHRPGVTPRVPDDLPGMARSISPNAAYQYGDIRLRFGRSASDRSTMTAGDSIRSDFTPVPISNPSLETLAVGNMNRVNGNTYIETQTLGGLNFDELVGIDVPRNMVEQVRRIVGDRVPIFPY